MNYIDKWKSLIPEEEPERQDQHGRILEQHRVEQDFLEPVRMLHIYPKERQMTARKEKPVPEKKSGRKKEQKKPEETEKVKPSNRPPFQVREIPSPIYGLELQRERAKRYMDSRRPAVLDELNESESRSDLEEPEAVHAELPKTEEPEERQSGGESAISLEVKGPKHRVTGFVKPQESENKQPGKPEPVEQINKPADTARYDPAPVTRPHVEKDKKSRTKPGEPFNVLMQPRDKVKQRRKPVSSSYRFPGLNLLQVPPKPTGEQEDWARETAEKLDETLGLFQVKAKVVTWTSGPAVTQFEVQPEPGVKINKLVQLTDDLKRSLAAVEIRMEAPIPGRTTVGIEIPNQQADPVMLRTILRSREFTQPESSLTVPLGVNINGEAVSCDISSMPHGLIAGATGSGKSVCVNAMLAGILYKGAPEDVRLLLIDPKMVELAPFNKVPHLAAPVITDAKEATAALKWAVEEMERRYQLLAEAGVKDLERYNKKAEQKLPKLLIVIDELSDLMMTAPQEVEDAICRIAQKARACGIHLLVATQRPSVDVITGLIKANIPSRIAFAVSSQADSRTILDTGGAERLLGRGDMLYHPVSSSKPMRIQGAFLTDEELERVIDHAAETPALPPLFDAEALTEKNMSSSGDPLFEEAVALVTDQGSASASLLQRRFQIGYNRAARLIDEMESGGIISPPRGTKPRDVYLS
ncbi:DNA translocase FtsK [Alkalicoccus urumqiensis]|nr:DNA translocase FtsK [Alkalicoccus urumqiensis]